VVESIEVIRVITVEDWVEDIEICESESNKSMGFSVTI
jgi:hypothetical protein